jgi:hypothetical protein
VTNTDPAGPGDHVVTGPAHSDVAVDVATADRSDMAAGIAGGGHSDLAAAEHWIAALVPAPPLACTHLVRKPQPHVAVTLDATPGGRAVRFPGVEHLVGTLTVGEVLARSAIDRVEVLGGGTADPQTLLDTDDHVRPVWRDGELVLTTTPAAGGRLVPFERRNPTPCCAAH